MNLYVMTINRVALKITHFFPILCTCFFEFWISSHTSNTFALVLETRVQIEHTCNSAPACHWA